MQPVVNTVLPVLALVALGWWLSGALRLDVGTLANLALLVTSPALVFTALSRSRFDPARWLDVVAAVLFVAAISAGLALLATRRNPELRRGLVLSTAFWNAGNLPLPCCRLAFGDDGLAVATVAFVTMATLHATAGIWIAKGRGGVTEVLKAPLLHACAAGGLVAAFDLPVPFLIGEPLAMLGQMAIPLMLLSLGVQLRHLAVTEFRVSLGATGLRLLGGAGAVGLYVFLVPVDALSRNVLWVNAVMPSATINAVISQRYGANPAVVASTVVVSTLATVVTLPAVLALILPT